MPSASRFCRNEPDKAPGRQMREGDAKFVPLWPWPRCFASSRLVRKSHGHHPTRTQTAHLRGAHLRPANHARAEDDVEAPGEVEDHVAVSGGTAGHSSQLSGRAHAGEGSE